MSADDDAELLGEFLVEGRENLDRLERELLAFEDSGTSAEMVAAVFRTAHTVKGTAGFFGFTKLQHLMHTAETLLAHVRDGELVLTSPIVSLLLDATDSARTILAAIEARTGEGDEDLSALIGKLEAHAPKIAVRGHVYAHRHRARVHLSIALLIVMRFSVSSAMKSKRVEFNELVLAIGDREHELPRGCAAHRSQSRPICPAICPARSTTREFQHLRFTGRRTDPSRTAPRALDSHPS
jgi:chemotaxis protein histidine kinase CheA